MKKHLFSREGFVGGMLIGAALIAFDLQIAGALFMLGYLIVGWIVFVRAWGSKAASHALAVPTFIILLIAVPSLAVGYNRSVPTAKEYATILASHEATFDVLCASWRDGNWIDRSIGRYRGRDWCKDYVHRLPPASDEKTASTNATGNLWK